MTATTKLHEYPLNESTRILMRLEQSFMQVRHFRADNSQWGKQALLANIAEILSILDRNDLRQILCKEIERQLNKFQQFNNTPNVNTQKLEHLLCELNKQYNRICSISSKISRQIREGDELLLAILQRANPSSVLNNFEIPQLYYWLSQDLHLQEHNINEWMYKLSPIEDAINLLLRLMRHCATFELRTATNGLYQEPLNPQSKCQMVRLKLQGDGYIPEVSGGKHRISLRFLQAINSTGQQLIDASFSFYLAYCFA